MNYTVIWLFGAQEMLAAVWTAAANQKSVTEATYRIERRLADNPLDVGESRHSNHRLAFDPPFQVMFRVFAGDKRVEVVSVGAFGRG